MCEDVWSESQLDVLDVFNHIELLYYNTITDQCGERLSLPDMKERKMIIETRPRYPSNKLIFTTADITKNKAIRWFNVGFNLKRRFNVDVVLEDSQRNFLSSFKIIFFIN